MLDIIGGILGLINGNKDKQYGYDLEREGLDLERRRSEPLIKAMEAMLGKAMGYDPAKETEEAVDFATKRSGQQLERTLGNFTAKYAAGGGTPGNSSAFKSRVQGRVDDSRNELEGWIADRKSGDFVRSMQALGMILSGNPGDLSSNYFKAAKNHQGGDMGGAFGMLSQGLGRIFS